jgi:hypothetical protein
MSYLTIPNLNSFDKAVISFWFRVPQASLDAAGAQADADTEGTERLSGLVPLVVFGKEGTSRATAEPSNQSEPLTTSTAVNQCIEHASDALEGNAAVAGSVYHMYYWPECDSFTSERTYYKSTISYSAKPGKPTNPSYIAIDRYGNLQINFESVETGDVVLPYDITSVTDKYYTQETVNECWTFSEAIGCETLEQTVVSGGGFWGLLTILFSILAFRLTTAVPDVLIDQGSSPREEHKASTAYGPVPGDAGTGAISFSPPVNLDADKWHHVLVSIDMSGGSASTGIPAGGSYSFADVSRISATSTMYVAIDDVNYPTGGNLFPDTNKVVTGSAVTIAFTGQAINYDNYPNITPAGPVPSYSLANMSVPAAEVGIPSVKTYVDKIRHVEMAEFLIFTGVTLDTSVEKNRRLFITGKGEPVNPTPIMIPVAKTAVGDPATWEPGADVSAFISQGSDPSAIGSGNKLLGTPAVDFTKCSLNWMMGRNLGNAKGKVVKTGKIKAYSPDPKLGK